MSASEVFEVCAVQIFSLLLLLLLFHLLGKPLVFSVFHCVLLLGLFVLSTTRW